MAPGHHHVPAEPRVKASQIIRKEECVNVAFIRPLDCAVYPTSKHAVGFSGWYL